MLHALRQEFNASWTEAKYRDFIRTLETRTGATLGFPLSETPCFFPQSLMASLAQTPYKVGDALLRRPRHSASIDATVAHRHVSAFAQLQTRGAALDAEPAFGPTGGLYLNRGHTVVNIGASLRAGTVVEIFARASNLFDRRYEEVLGYPAPGRTAYVGARIAVGR